jgi:hypothetical protein
MMQRAISSRYKIGDKAISSRYKIGDLVFKQEGYDFPGIVRAVFLTGQGDLRYVVESSWSKGLLHIFNETQLTLGTGRGR